MHANLTRITIICVFHCWIRIEKMNVRLEGKHFSNRKRHHRVVRCPWVRLNIRRLSLTRPITIRLSHWRRGNLVHSIVAPPENNSVLGMRRRGDIYDTIVMRGVLIQLALSSELWWFRGAYLLTWVQNNKLSPFLKTVHLHYWKIRAHRSPEKNHSINLSLCLRKWKVL